MSRSALKDMSGMYDCDKYYILSLEYIYIYIYIYRSIYIYFYTSHFPLIFLFLIRHFGIRKLHAFILSLYNSFLSTYYFRFSKIACNEITFLCSGTESVEIEDGEGLTVGVGTPLYCSPEELSMGHYTEKVITEKSEMR